MKKIVITAIFLGFGLTSIAQTIKVMTYNLHHGADTANVDRLDAIAKFIKDSGAELVGLQEIDSVCKRSGNVDQMKRLSDLTGMYYAFARHMAYDGGAYGQGILSRYPINNIQNHRITLIKKNGTKDSRALLAVDVKLPERKKLVFASVHFALDVPSRMIQSEETINYLMDKKHPVILTGDLNSEPDKAEIINLQKYFAVTDRQNLLTFPVEKPIKKIDYIFVNKNFLKEVVETKVFKDNKLSDHLPLMGTVKLNEK